MALINPAVAQKKEEKIPPTDTVKGKFLPTGLRIGTDMISIIKSQIKKDFKGWEVNADIDFYRYFLAVDYGNWSRNYILTNGTYQNNGNYFRIGTDVNFMLREAKKNMFFMGFRYGHSVFNESTTYHYVDSLPGITTKPVITKSFANANLTAHWLEITTGLRLRIWGPIWMGYLARVKFGPSVKGYHDLHPFDIPGYGLAEKKNYWGINYQIFWRFPVRKIR